MTAVAVQIRRLTLVDLPEIEAIDASGASPFGRIDQRVVGGGS